MRAPVSGVAWIALPTRPAGPAPVVQSCAERATLASWSSASTTARPETKSTAPSPPGSGAAAVVNDQVWAVARALPAASSAAVVTVAVYWVAGARSALGFRVKVVSPAEAATPAATAGPPAVGARLKDAPVTVTGSIASENVATTSASGATPVAPAAGVRPVRVGGVRSGPVGSRPVTAGP